MALNQTQFPRLEFNKGDTIFKEGQNGQHAFLIRTGRVTIYTKRSGKKVYISTMVPGQILGEMSILTGEPRTASAEAAEYCELLVINKETFGSTLNETLPIVKALLNQLIYRIQETDRKRPPEGGDGRNPFIEESQGRIRNLERAMTTIYDNTADWLLAYPKMDPSIKQCLQLINEVSRRELGR